MALTNEQINDSDALVNLLKTVGPLSAREIYAVIGKQTARVLGFAVQSGRVIKVGDSFKLPAKSSKQIADECMADWAPSSYADR